MQSAGCSWVLLLLVWDGLAFEETAALSQYNDGMVAFNGRYAHVSSCIVESTEGISETWFREPFPRWGIFRFRVGGSIYLWVRVHPEFI